MAHHAKARRPARSLPSSGSCAGSATARATRSFTKLPNSTINTFLNIPLNTSLKKYIALAWLTPALTFLTLAAPTSWAQAAHQLTSVNQLDTTGNANLIRLLQQLATLSQNESPDSERATVIRDLLALSQTRDRIRRLRGLLPAIERNAGNVNLFKTRQGRLRQTRHTLGAGQSAILSSQRPLNSNQPVLSFGVYQPTLMTTGSQADTLSSEETRRRTNVWAQGWVDNTEQSSSDQFDGFDANQQGLSIGVDFNLNEAWTLSSSLTHHSGEVDSDLLGQDDTQGYQLNLAAAWSVDEHQLSLSAYRGWDTIDRVRTVITGSATAPRYIELLSEIDAVQTGAALDYSYTHFPNSNSLIANPAIPLVTLLAGVDFTNIETDDYLERGAESLRLAVETKDEEQITGHLGISLSWALFTENWSIMPSISATYEHDIQADPTVTVSRFRGASRGFETKGLNVESSRIRAGAGISFLHNDDVALGVFYQGSRSGDFDQDGLALNLSLSF